MDSSTVSIILPAALGLLSFGVLGAITRQFFLPFVTGIIFAMIGAMLSLLLIVFPSGEQESTETYTLKTVGTGTQIEGRSSFLMGGYIESSPSYQFMMEVPEENGSGVYNEGVEAKITDVKVYEVDNEEPTVTIHTTATTNPFGDEISSSKKYEVRVPEGSIVESTDIDFSK